MSEQRDLMELGRAVTAAGESVVVASAKLRRAERQRTEAVREYRAAVADLSRARAALDSALPVTGTTSMQGDEAGVEVTL